MAIPPGVSQRDWNAALDEFRQAVGAAWVFTSDDDIALYRDAYSPLWGEADERLVSAAVAPDSAEQVSRIVRDRQPLQDSALSDLDREEPRLRRLRSEPLGKRRRRPQANEPRHRGRRQATLRDCRARRRLLRSVPAHPGPRAEGVDRLSGSRVGQSGRQLAGPRRGLHIRRVSRSLPLALRHGGGPAERRHRAHRYGCAARLQDVGRVSLRLRSDGGRTVRAGQLRHRHQDGIPSVAGARARTRTASSRCRAATTSCRSSTSSTSSSTEA